VSKESKKSPTEYRQRVIDAIVDKGMAARAEVCQMCGKIRSFRGMFAFWGAHYVDVEGKKEFVCGHCKAKKGGRHLAKADSKRFCELCTQRFTPKKKNDFPGSWVCNPCLKKIDKPPGKVGKFLSEFCLRRYLESSGMSDDELCDLDIKLAVQQFEMEGGQLSPLEQLQFKATREKRLEALLKRLSAFHGMGPSEIVTETPNQHDKSSNVIGKDGDIWTITFRGNSVRLGDLKGLTYIVYLLQHPNEIISATRLVGITENQTSGLYNEMSNQQIEEEGLRQVVDLGDSGKAADSKTMKEVKRRLLEIEDEKMEAERLADSEKYDQLEEKTEQLKQYLSRNYGLRNKPRRSGSHDDRMRINVNRDIKRVVGKIRKQNEALAAYLKSTIKTGFQVSYTPDPNNPVSWPFLPS